MHKSVEKISVRYLNELRRYNYLTHTSFNKFLQFFQDTTVIKLNDNTYFHRAIKKYGRENFRNT